MIPVLTKADKLKMRERTRALRRILETLTPFGVDAEDVVWFSATTHEGRDKLWRCVLECLER